MESKNPLEEYVIMYRKRIERFSNCQVTPWPGLEALRKFMKEGYSCSFPPGYPKLKQKPIEACNSPAEISIINVPREGERLPSLAENSSSSQLIIVENVCPDTLALLGEFYNIGIQFFAEYTNVISWYRIYERIAERLPALPSARNAKDFLSLTYVSTRQLYEKDDSSIYVDSVLYPDMEETRVGNSAGRLQPISAPKQILRPMVFTRQCFNLCFFLYSTIGLTLNQFWKKYILVKEESEEGQEEENGLNGIKLSQYLMSQTSNGSVV